MDLAMSWQSGRCVIPKETIEGPGYGIAQQFFYSSIDERESSGRVQRKDHIRYVFNEAAIALFGLSQRILVGLEFFLQLALSGSVPHDSRETEDSAVAVRCGSTADAHVPRPSPNIENLQFSVPNPGTVGFEQPPCGLPIIENRKIPEGCAEDLLNCCPRSSSAAMFTNVNLPFDRA